MEPAAYLHHSAKVSEAASRLLAQGWSSTAPARARARLGPSGQPLFHRLLIDRTPPHRAQHLEAAREALVTDCCSWS